MVLSSLIKASNFMRSAGLRSRNARPPPVTLKRSFVDVTPRSEQICSPTPSNPCFFRWVCRSVSRLLLTSVAILDPHPIYSLYTGTSDIISTRINKNHPVIISKLSRRIMIKDENIIVGRTCSLSVVTSSLPKQSVIVYLVLNCGYFSHR